MMPLVTVCIPTADNVEPQCLESVRQQDYAPFDLMVNAMPPQEQIADAVRGKSINSTHNRNAARQKLLAGASSYFLFVDSDTVLPRDALGKLMRHGKDIVGGWYQTLNGEKWVAGCWGPNGIFHHYISPQRSLVLADMVGLGCVLISRRALEKIPFNHGTDKTGKAPNGKRFCYIGPCAQFGLDAREAGFRCYMDGDVICQHIARAGTCVGNPEFESAPWRRDWK